MRTAQRIGIIIPLANEAKTLPELLGQLCEVLQQIPIAEIYFVVDDVSKDDTRNMCQSASETNSRLHYIYSPENKNVVDAYLAGFKAAYANECDLFIEMDGGLSHDPHQIPVFVKAYEAGYDCVFGSRFITGGQLVNANFKRRFFSKTGTVFANLLLGTRFKDMTSGYEAFDRFTMQHILGYPLKSKAHFYQTEIRYLCRNKNYVEIPIIHRSPAPHLHVNSIQNAINALFFYFFKRLRFQSAQFI
jgi:dolichol-phosphate mannosyltransferase